MKQINDTAYAEGHKFFRKGHSLRSIVEPIVRHTNGPLTEKDHTLTREQIDEKENAMFSRLLGFADAALDALRRR